MRLWGFLVVVLLAGGPAQAQERVHFPSAGNNATELDGYLYRPAGDGPHPALVFMHGCGGLLNKSGRPWTRESDWARRFNALGWVVLMVDSFTPRGSSEMCSQAGFQAMAVSHPAARRLWRARLSARPALRPARPDRPDRLVPGWRRHADGDSRPERQPPGRSAQRRLSRRGRLLPGRLPRFRPIPSPGRRRSRCRSWSATRTSGRRPPRAGI